MKVLAIGAHPDDAELCCFGTLSRCIARGDSVVVCSVTNGNKGHHQIAPEKLRLIRMAEAAKAAELIGATYSTLDVDDMTLQATDESVLEKMTAMLCSVRPDVIITHDTVDYHPDHIQTALLVLRSVMQASLPQVSSHLTHKVIVYHMDRVGGGQFLPTDYVDITQTYGLKSAALECHVSQLDLFEQESSRLNLLRAMRIISEYRGLQCSCQYAEAFRISDQHQNSAVRLLP